MGVQRRTMIQALFDGLRELFASWFGGEADPVSSPLATAPRDDVMWQRRGVYVRIFQTRALTQRNGSIPEETVARFLEANFSRVGAMYHIEFGGRVEVPDHLQQYQQKGGHQKSHKLLSWLGDAYVAHNVRVRPDVWLLIDDSPGGGYGGPYMALGPGRNIDRRLPITERGYTRAYDNVRACLHEVGHAFRGRHDDHMIPKPRMFYTEQGIKAFGIGEGNEGFDTDG